MSDRGKCAASGSAIPGAGFGLFWRGAALPSVLILAWTLTAHLGLIRSNLLPPIERVVALPFFDEAGRELWAGLAASVLRLMAGFVVGAAAGVALGFATGMSRTADRAIGPSIHALRQIALFAWIPLLTAWFGNGEIAKIVYIALSAFFPAALNTHEGVRNIPPQYLDVAGALRLSRRTRIARLLFPGALPSIFVGIQLALITAWLSTVGAEYAMGTGRGVGSFMAAGREQFRMDVVILGVIVLALAGYAVNTGCTWAFRKMLHGSLEGA
jgi:sulfonate transport system permease protein